MLLSALIANYEFSRSNPDNFQLPFEMQLFEKLQTFSGFYIAFLQSALKFEHFEQKDEPHGSSISEVIESQKRLY